MKLSNAPWLAVAMTVVSAIAVPVKDNSVSAFKPKINQRGAVVEANAGLLNRRVSAELKKELVYSTRRQDDGDDDDDNDDNDDDDDDDKDDSDDDQDQDKDHE
ncbi:hypothetical protein FQN57_002884 [Myotisia sp. PD_48]|nr:hypothetical protein FQN57_002884 [Myotisia sp. PD_48]